MKKKVKAALTPFGNLNFAVDVQFQFDFEGANLELLILANGCSEPSQSLNVQADDVDDINTHLRNSVEDLANAYELGAVSKKTEREKLQSLATSGYYAFKKLFCKDELQTLVRKLTDSAKCIQIVSGDCIVPWELIYPEDPSDKIDVTKFWGFKHIIHRVIPNSNTKFPHPTIPAGARPRMGLLADRSLRSVADRELPYLERLRKEKKISLHKIEVLLPDAVHHLQELRKFHKFFANQFHIVHWACHAKHDSALGSQSYLRLSDSFHLTIKDLETLEIVLKEHPFVLLNACETGKSNPYSTAQFARLFLNKGARGVLAAEAKLPDGFAAVFAEQLYHYLLKGLSLGESVYLARTDFLDEKKSPLKYSNPSALLYSMYSPPSLRLDLN